MSIRPQLRFQILRRDSFTCQYCGRSAPDVVLHVDHVLPTARGGSNRAQNLLTACSDCNGGKGALDLDDSPHVPAVDLPGFVPVEQVMCWQITASQFLSRVPAWLRDQAERAADHDFECAGEPEPDHFTRLPHVVRHVGHILFGIDLAPPPITVEPAEFPF